jgi:hypothetical protein
MDLHSIPYRPGLLRGMIDDFEIGQFGDGYFGKMSRGKATLQFYLTGDFGDVTLQVHASAGLMLVSSKLPLSAYLKAVAERHGIDPWDVHWEYQALAEILRERKQEPADVSEVVAELPWALTTFRERGIMIACGSADEADDSLPQPEVTPPWVIPGVNTALAFFKDLIPWSDAATPIDYSVDRMIRDGDCMGLEEAKVADVQDAIDKACMARNAVVLRNLLKRGTPRQDAWHHCMANKDVPCMTALAAALPPTGEQLHAIARSLSLPDFLKVAEALPRSHVHQKNA